MNNTIIFLLAVLDWMAELTQLSYELGALTRKYAVPALVAVYVACELVWDKLTTYEYNIKFYNTPLTCGLA